MDKTALLNAVRDYYSEKVRQFGPQPAGVDWNSQISQYIRFEQMVKLIVEKPFSVLDYGCGYGAFYEYLLQLFTPADISYTGYDISEDMIQAAVDKFGKLNFTTTHPDGNNYDYIIASGIFNVKPSGQENYVWENYIAETINIFNSISVKGFAFNLLTHYADKEKKQPHLYYADPLYYFDYCKKNVSKNVALLHDYNLYEFTIIIRK